MKKAVSIILTLVFFIGVFSGCAPKREDVVNVGVLKGPTGIGMSYLMNQNDNGGTENEYSFTVAISPNELIASLTSGQIDIAALPTNTAANLYSKTNGGIEIIALNTLGVLYILENGSELSSIEDLRGRTIYSTGQGANPEYVLNYILRQNGLQPEKDVTVEYRDSEEIVTLMTSGNIDICMLPVPYVQTVLANSEKTRIAFDMNEQWSHVENGGSSIAMGCLAAKKEFIEENKDIIDKFLEEYKQSIEFMSDNTEQGAEMVVRYGIAGDEQIAEASIKASNIVCITGEDIKNTINGYFEVLFEAMPSSIGGSIPDDGFYYAG